MQFRPIRASLGITATLAILLLVACTERTNEGAAGTSARTETETSLTRLAQDPTLQWGACPEIFPAGCEITVLHGDPSQPNADVFLRVPGGYEIPPHSHTSAERMILVGGELNVQYQGAPAVTLSVGEYAYGPPGLPHRASCVSADPCTLFIAFVQPVDALTFEGSLE
jgi:quercetin dioxygenase-like cupin family protein